MWCDTAAAGDEIDLRQGRISRRTLLSMNTETHLVKVELLAVDVKVATALVGDTTRGAADVDFLACRGGRGFCRQNAHELYTGQLAFFHTVEVVGNGTSRGHHSARRRQVRLDEQIKRPVLLTMKNWADGRIAAQDGLVLEM